MKHLDTIPDTCPHCGSEHVGWTQRLMHPRGYVWFWRCVTCGWRVEA